MRWLRSFCVAAGILLAASTAWSETAAPHFNGHDWRSAGLALKQLYVAGFLSGVVLGQDRVARRLLLSNGGPDFHPECQPVVVKAINAMEAQLERLDPAQLVAALDTFYEREENRPLPLRWAVVKVLQEVQDPATATGTPPRAP